MALDVGARQPFGASLQDSAVRVYQIVVTDVVYSTSEEQPPAALSVAMVYAISGSDRIIAWGSGGVMDDDTGGPRAEKVVWPVPTQASRQAIDTAVGRGHQRQSCG